MIRSLYTCIIKSIIIIINTCLYFTYEVVLIIDSNGSHNNYAHHYNIKYYQKIGYSKAGMNKMSVTLPHVVLYSVVSEARHGEGSGEQLHPLAELRDARHRLLVLQQEGPEAGQIPCWERENKTTS